jgi:tetratricopeptide (TPR) repeat protein
LREDWSLPMAALGGILVDRNQFAEAETVLLKAIELDEMNYPAYTALTELRLKTKAPPEVLKELLTKLQYLTSKASPTASIWAARASVERILGDRTAAKLSIARALAIEPNNKSARIEQIELNLAENDFKAALENAKNFVKIAPDSIVAKFLLARAFAANGNADEALKILDSVPNPTNEMTAFRDRIIAVTTTKAADLEKQLESDPKNAAILGRLCSLLRVDDPPKALEYCRRAYEAEPNNLNYVIGFGAALVQAKQFARAVVIFQKIIEIAPDNYTAHANLAVALFQLKQYAEAKKEYQWLAAKQPDLAITYYFLGIIHDQLKEYADAVANYQQFLRLADTEKNKLEIEKVNLRLPAVQKLVKKK